MDWTAHERVLETRVRRILPGSGPFCAVLCKRLAGIAAPDTMAARHGRGVRPHALFIQICRPLHTHAGARSVLAHERNRPWNLTLCHLAQPNKARVLAPTRHRPSGHWINIYDFSPSARICMALDFTVVHVSECRNAVILCYICSQDGVLSVSTHSELVKGRNDMKIHGNTHKNYKKNTNFGFQPKNWCSLPLRTHKAVTVRAERSVI